MVCQKKITIYSLFGSPCMNYALYPMRSALCTVRYVLHTLPYAKQSYVLLHSMPYAKQKSCPAKRSPTVPPPPPSYVPTVTLTSFTRLFLCIIYTLAVSMHNTKSLPEMKYTFSSNISKDQNFLSLELRFPPTINSWQPCLE